MRPGPAATGARAASVGVVSDSPDVTDLPDHLDVEVAGLRRRLPVRRLTPDLAIAYVQLMGDVEWCAAAAAGLVRLADAAAEVVVAPELKGVVLAHEVARAAGLPYVVLRKQERSYMAGSTSVEVRSVTGDGSSRLWLSGDDADLVRGRRVWLVDDVCSTGNSLAACRDLLVAAGAEVVEQLVVFTEGDAAAGRTDLRALGHLPLLRPAAPGPAPAGA